MQHLFQAQYAVAYCTPVLFWVVQCISRTKMLICSWMPFIFLHVAVQHHSFLVCRALLCSLANAWLINRSCRYPTCFPHNLVTLTVRFAQQEFRGQIVWGAQYLGPQSRHGAPANTLGGPEGGVGRRHGLGRLAHPEKPEKTHEKLKWLENGRNMTCWFKTMPIFWKWTVKIDISLIYELRTPNTGYLWISSEPH